jgi:hypothetical protein
VSKPKKVYTFKTLKSERGWPYSRQHTTRLVSLGRFPKPKKAPGGALNIWTDEQIDSYYASLPSSETNDSNKTA